MNTENGHDARTGSKSGAARQLFVWAGKWGEGGIGREAQTWFVEECPLKLRCETISDVESEVEIERLERIIERRRVGEVSSL